MVIIHPGNGIGLARSRGQRICRIDRFVRLCIYPLDFRLTCTEHIFNAIRPHIHNGHSIIFLQRHSQLILLLIVTYSGSKSSGVSRPAF